MKTAFSRWDDRIAPVFDTARQIQIIETESGRILSEGQAMLPENLPHQKVLRLAELNVGILVCGAISRPLHGLIDTYGIQVIPFVAGDLREVIEAWLRGDLGRNTFTMPGCHARARRHGKGPHASSLEARAIRGRGHQRGAGHRKG